MTNLLLKNVRPMGAPATSLAISQGVFAEHVPHGTEEIDCGGRILIPGLVEAHTHLDKSLIGLPWYRNEVGPRLIDRITNEREMRVSLGLDPRIQSERQAIQSIGYGTTSIRSHVDVDTHHRLANECRDRFTAFAIDQRLQFRDAMGDKPRLVQCRIFTPVIIGGFGMENPVERQIEFPVVHLKPGQ